MKKRKKLKNNRQTTHILANRPEKEKPPFPSPAFIMAVMVLSVIGFGFYKFANHMISDSQMFQLKSIRVEGNQYIKSEKITRLAKVETGGRLFKVSTDAIINRLLNYPYLKGVSVSRSLPSTLIISVQERQPVAYLIDTQIYMVDSYGKILLKKPGMSDKSLPVITGLSVNNLLKNREPLYEALNLVGKIKEVDKTLIQFISEIHIDKQKPPHFYLIRGGARVEIGTANLYEKIYLLSEFVKKPAILNELENMKRIDLTFSDRIIVTRKS